MINDFVKRRDTFIVNAIEILDEMGIQGLSTREIARREGVSEPIIYKQFKNKNEILLSLVNEFGKFDDYIMRTVLEQNMSPKNGIIYFMTEIVGVYENYPEITSVLLSMDVFRHDELSNNKMKEILFKRKSFIKELIEKGQINCTLSNSINSDEFSEIILGIMLSNIYHWKLFDTSNNLKNKIRISLEFLLNNK